MMHFYWETFKCRRLDSQLSLPLETKQKTKRKTTRHSPIAKTVCYFSILWLCRTNEWFLDNHFFHSQCQSSTVCIGHLVIKCYWTSSQNTTHYHDHRDTSIKFLEAIPPISSVATNVIKITIPKKGGHFERLAAIGRRNMPFNSNVALSSAQKTSACLRK